MGITVLVLQLQSFVSERAQHWRDVDALQQVDVEITSVSFPCLLPLEIALRPAARDFPSLSVFLVDPYFTTLVVLNNLYK